MSIPGNINAGSPYGGPQVLKKLEIYIPPRSSFSLALYSKGSLLLGCLYEQYLL